MAKRKKGKPSLLAIIIFIVIALLGVKETGLVEIDNSKLTNSRLDGEVYVHFIDVGQGSSTLIQQSKNGIIQYRHGHCSHNEHNAATSPLPDRILDLTEVYLILFVYILGLHYFFFPFFL